MIADFSSARTNVSSEFVGRPDVVGAESVSKSVVYDLSDFLTINFIAWSKPLHGLFGIFFFIFLLTLSVAAC